MLMSYQQFLVPKLRICEVCKSVLEGKMQQIEESKATPLGLEEFQVSRSLI